MGTQNLEELDNLINQYANEIEEKTIMWRRDFHENPELGCKEYRTSKIVADHLRELGFDEVRVGLGGGTGVVGILKGKNPGPVVGLRADMDALPIKEKTEVPFASKAIGNWGGMEVPVMHACGHDAHTAILMAAGEIFARLRSDLCGTVVLLFQPAEEGADIDWKGARGARLMVQEGALDDPKPDAMFALHVNANAQRGSAGDITCHSGAASYAMSMFRLAINGKEGHAAMPWLGIDAGVTAAQVLLALQTIPSRNVDVFNNHVTLSIGTIHGGKKFNVVPDRVIMEGALRITDATTRFALQKRVEDIADHISKSAGGSSEVDWYNWDPQLFNDPKLVEKMFPSIIKVAGKEHCMIAEPPALDDYSHISQIISSIFLLLSIAPDEDDPREVGGHHTPTFYINEKALINGVKVMLQLTFDYMNKHK